MKREKIIKNYYIGFLTNANDPLPTYSCYSEKNEFIKVTSKPNLKDVAYIFFDSDIKKNWVHFFKVKETLFDFTELGFKSNKESEYFISFSRENLEMAWRDIEYLN